MGYCVCVGGGGSSLSKMLQGVLTGNTLEEEEKAGLSVWKSVPSRGGSTCKGPGARVCLAC